MKKVFIFIFKFNCCVSLKADWKKVNTGNKCHVQRVIHRGRDKMKAMLQTLSSYVLFWMKTSGPRQNGSYVTNDILICVVLNGKSLHIYIQISLLCFLKVRWEKANTGPNTQFRPPSQYFNDDDPFSDAYKRYLASAVCWRRRRITHPEIGCRLNAPYGRSTIGTRLSCVYSMTIVCCVNIDYLQNCPVASEVLWEDLGTLDQYVTTTKIQGESCARPSNLVDMIESIRHRIRQLYNCRLQFAWCFS